MSTFLDSYVLRVLFASPTRARGLEAGARRAPWLKTPPLCPYRPELHYVRGPGPALRGFAPVGAERRR
jgi:hypothetical protein